MSHFSSGLYQVDAETLRALNRLANRFREGSVMTAEERTNVALRMKALLRQAKLQEAEGNFSHVIEGLPGPMRGQASLLQRP
jgi:hypothetical protein